MRRSGKTQAPRARPKGSGSMSHEQGEETPAPPSESAEDAAARRESEPASGQVADGDDRSARLAAALRDNLKKRKRQAKLRRPPANRGD